MGGGNYPLNKKLSGRSARVLRHVNIINFGATQPVWRVPETGFGRHVTGTAESIKGDTFSNSANAELSAEGLESIRREYTE